MELAHNLVKLLEMHVTLLTRGSGGGGGGDAKGLSPLLSPYLGGALLWCLNRFSAAYLLPDLTLYQVRKPCFLYAYGT